MGTNPGSLRSIRVALESESVASFPVESQEAPSALTDFGSRPRLLSIRTNLDDEAGAFAQAGVGARSIRQSLDDAGDSSSPSAGRRLRSTLD